MKADHISAIEKIVASVAYINGVYEQLEKAVECRPESPVAKAMYALVDPCLIMLSEKIGDKDDWLRWFVWDNGCGKHGCSASASSASKMRRIKTVSDLVKIIDASGRKPKLRKQKT